MDAVTFTELPREAKRFRPGKAYRYLDFGDTIDDARPDTIAYAAIAGNHRAVEFIYGDASIPQFLPKPLSNEVECTRCCQSKPRSAFGRDPRKANGLQSICRACDRGRKKIYRLRHARWFEDANESTNRPVNGAKSA